MRAILENNVVTVVVDDTTTFTHTITDINDLIDFWIGNDTVDINIFTDEHDGIFVHVYEVCNGVTFVNDLLNMCILEIK